MLNNLVTSWTLPSNIFRDKIGTHLLLNTKFLQSRLRLAMSENRSVLVKYSTIEATKETLSGPSCTLVGLTGLYEEIYI